MTAKVKLCSAAEWVAPVALSQHDWGWKPVQELAAWYGHWTAGNDAGRMRLLGSVEISTFWYKF